MIFMETPGGELWPKRQATSPCSAGNNCVIVLKCGRSKHNTHGWDTKVSCFIIGTKVTLYQFNLLWLSNHQKTSHGTTLRGRLLHMTTSLFRWRLFASTFRFWRPWAMIPRARDVMGCRSKYQKTRGVQTSKASMVFFCSVCWRA